MSFNNRATLESICSLIVDCPHSTPFWTNSGYLVVRNQNIKNGQLDLSERSYTDHAHYLIRIRRAKPQFGDLIFTREAPMGDVCMVPEGLECCVGQRQVLLRPNPEKVIPRYLLYAIQSPEVQHEISWSEGTGSTVSNVRIPVLKKLRIPIRDLSEQVEVATLLGALDDRITLLRETNATLEAIAQAIFKSWFVDFDPVRAKQEGRAPEGMDEATAALFPDSFEESALGLVPSGWRVGTFADLLRLHKGTVNPLTQPDVVFEHYSLPAFDDGQMPIAEAGAEIKSNKTPVPANAVLISKLNPHIPRVWMPTDAGQHAVCSTEFLVFVPAGGASKYFNYCSFSAPQFLQSLCQLVTGTSNSHQRVKPDGILSMPTIVATGDVLSSFGALAGPMFDRIGHNRKQAQTLATLRDTLLPRLISGQLRLPDAEDAIAEAAT